VIKKVGTSTVVDIETGEVVSKKRNAMALLPPGDNVCQECAVDHSWSDPHNQQSLYYQMHFHSTHGRWPTWSDAMAHCTPEVQAHWRKQLIALMEKNGLDVPADLREPARSNRR
jgi:hypothetical protein